MSVAYPSKPRRVLEKIFLPVSDVEARESFRSTLPERQNKNSNFLGRGALALCLAVGLIGVGTAIVSRADNERVFNPDAGNPVDTDGAPVEEPLPTFTSEVQYGDTLSGIAGELTTSNADQALLTRELEVANGGSEEIYHGDVIKAGQFDDDPALDWEIDPGTHRPDTDSFGATQQQMPRQ